MSDDRSNEEPGKLEEIKQENALLKMKLTAEFGMTDSGGNIDPEIENAWLKNIYEFEKSFAESRFMITLEDRSTEMLVKYQQKKLPPSLIE